MKKEDMRGSTLKTFPESYEYLPQDVMTNFDHSIDREIEAKLKSGKFMAAYPAWDFHGMVWFEGGKFWCQIDRFHRHIDTLSTESLDELMEIASEKHGYG